MNSPSSYKRALVSIVLSLAVAAAVYLVGLEPQSAEAITAAEKRAEADAVYAQIDSLQTSLNEATAQYEAATSAHDEAIALRDEAACHIQEETARIEELQSDLSVFMVGMYKRGGTETYLDVMLQTSSFDDFITSWDACNSISDRGNQLIEEAKTSRKNLEKAKATYEAEGQRAQREMESAQSLMAQIENTKAALQEEASKLSAEADELQMQEELAAEAARQAEEARQRQEEALAGGGAGESVLMGNGYFTNPCPGASNSSGFGYRSFDHAFHKGTDMAAPEGTPYYAADSGTVMYATNGGGYNGGAGNWVVISHGNGIVTKYMHSQVTFVRPGDYVERGQNIGLVGNTGQSFGAHLHFQVEVNGVAVNPHNYI